MLLRIVIAYCETVLLIMKYLTDIFSSHFKCTLCSQLFAVTGQAVNCVETFKQDTETFKFNTHYYCVQQRLILLFIGL